MNESFVSSLKFDNHPISGCNSKAKEDYYLVLSYIVNCCVQNNIVSRRLDMYKSFLSPSTENANEKGTSIAFLRQCCRSWKKKYQWCLLCDVMLITLGYECIEKAVGVLQTLLPRKYRASVDTFADFLFGKSKCYSSYKFAKPLIDQYNENISFMAKKEQNYIVTANISAGKSTLINALVGKSVTRMSQEICTGNICSIYNKPFEDGRIHLQTDDVNLSADSSDIRSLTWEHQVKVAAYFRNMFADGKRICIIDTPGVNAATNISHGNISHDVLLNKVYDKVIYVLNANKLGTDEEVAHMRWIAKNVPKNKVVFVLNKLDCFKAFTDNISESILGVKSDLNKLGFEDPLICPISAYFALLIKKKFNGDLLNEDEMDEYKLFFSKFNKSSYDLSVYYRGMECDDDDSEELLMSKKCGLYGLEKILFGG